MTDETKALVEELRLNDAEIYLPLLGKAADLIETQTAEIERLREALASHPAISNPVVDHDTGNMGDKI